MNDSANIKPISYNDFKVIQNLMMEYAGISLGEKKSQLVENRLRGRLTALGLKDYSEYVQYISSPQNKIERDQCIESLTTNETFFFRHKMHWDFFNEVFIKECHLRKKNNISTKIWSAASSTGAEAYSAAICLFNLLDNSSSPCWSVDATDINRKVLEYGKRGIFNSYSLQKCTPYCRDSFFTRVSSDQFSIKENLKIKVNFKTHNLFSNQINNKYHLIFLRNVLIYFDSQHKQTVLKNVISQLFPGGYLLLGGAESIKASDWKLRTIMPTIYQYVLKK